MRKSELAERIASEHGLPKAQAERILGTVLDGIVTAVSQGDQVALAGFGQFELHERAAREGRNPRTGEVIPIKPQKALVFRAAKAVRDLLNPQ